MVVVGRGVIIVRVGQLNSKSLLVVCFLEDCRHVSSTVVSSWAISSFRIGVDEVVSEVVNGMRRFWALWVMQAAFFDHLRVHSKVRCHGCPRIIYVSVVSFGKTLNSCWQLYPHTYIGNLHIPKRLVVWPEKLTTCKGVAFNCG